MFCTAFHHLKVLSAPKVLAERLRSCTEPPSVSKGQESKNGYLKPAKEEGLENTICCQMGPPKEYIVWGGLKRESPSMSSVQVCCADFPWENLLWGTQLRDSPRGHTFRSTTMVTQRPHFPPPAQSRTLLKGSVCLGAPQWPHWDLLTLCCSLVYFLPNPPFPLFFHSCQTYSMVWGLPLRLLLPSPSQAFLPINLWHV